MYNQDFRSEGIRGARYRSNDKFLKEHVDEVAIKPATQMDSYNNEKYYKEPCTQWKGLCMYDGKLN